MQVPLRAHHTGHSHASRGHATRPRSQRKSALARAGWAPAHRHYPTFQNFFLPVVPADSRIAFAHVPLRRAPRGPRAPSYERTTRMHTTPKTVESARPDTRSLKEQLREERRLTELTMQRVQRTALDTLEELMAPPAPTGDASQDAINRLERNRRRLAANQALLHCRTMAREARARREARRKARAKAEREAKSSKKPVTKPTAKQPSIPTGPGRTLTAGLIASAGSLSSAAPPPCPNTTVPDGGPLPTAAFGARPESTPALHTTRPPRRTATPPPLQHC